MPLYFVTFVIYIAYNNNIVLDLSANILRAVKLSQVATPTG